MTAFTSPIVKSICLFYFFLSFKKKNAALAQNTNYLSLAINLKPLSLHIYGIKEWLSEKPFSLARAVKG